MTTNTQVTESEPGAGLGGQASTATLFARSVRAEWIKLRSIRSFYGCTVTAIGLSAGLTALLAWAVMAGEAEGVNTVESAASLAVAGVSLGQIAFLVLSALVLTGEYSTGAIRSTLAAVPVRPIMLAAKGVVLAAVAALTGALSILAGTITAAPVLSDEGPTTAAGLTKYAGLAALGVGLFALLVLSLGALIRNTAATITVTIALLFVPSIVASMASNETVSDVVTYLPATLQEALINGGTSNHDATTAGLLFGAWVVAALIAAGITLTRRDA